MPVVYGELRRLARRQMARERPDHTLQVTALVHEAYLRLLDVRQVDWQDRAHFLALSAQMMPVEISGLNWFLGPAFRSVWVSWQVSYP